MQTSEKLCLKWNDFQENLNSTFGGLRNDQDFADVTLVCEDGTQIETHKTILASSSPFFMDILKTNKHPHPMIYMRGLKADDLVAMVDFLYYGEANINQESLEVFFGLAEELRLKGLTGSSTKRNPRELIATEGIIEEKKYDVKSTPGYSIYKSNAKTESSLVTLVSVEADQLDVQIKSMMTRTENESKNGKSSAYNVCGKEDWISNTKSHIKSNHIESNISHSCDICGKVSRSKAGLRMHKSREH